MKQLPIFVNLQGRKIILLGDGEMADAKRRLYERAGAVICTDENTEGALLAVVALESAKAASEAKDRLSARGLLVNVVDRPDLCDFTTPAIVDRDPVLIAIGTGGASAGLAKALRQRFEQLLPAKLGALAEALYDARNAIKATWSNAADRRRAIDAALDSNEILDPYTDSAAKSVSKWLKNPAASSKNRTVEITLKSGDPDDLTLGQARILGQADRIYVHSSVPDAILSRARADAERVSVETFDNVEPIGLTLLIRLGG